VLRACCIRYRRERWLTPDGQLVVAPRPSGVDRQGRRMKWAGGI
jgi:hypothetical protein